jgi:CPA1 family monovalent cation:H+ antiporter
VVDTLVTGVAFGLIGLELHTVFGVAARHRDAFLADAGLITAVVVGVRLDWLLPAAWLAKRLHRLRDLDEDIPLSWRETVVMWWSGMRGVASVALVLAIPLHTDSGADFPAREEILFVAFVVVLATLVVQGLTLPRLVRVLGVRSDTDAEREIERRLALRAVKAAKRRLKEIGETEEIPDDLAENLARRAHDLGVRISPDILDEERRESHARRVKRIRTVQRVQSELLSAARHEVLAARSEPGFDPEIVDRVLHQLDLRSVRGVPRATPEP